MKKQYMDFMPAKPVKKTVKKPVQKPASKAPVVSKVSTTPKVVSQPKKVQKPAPKVASQAKSTPKLGEIEDLTARYTEADLKKRPLGEKRQPEVKHAELAKIKAQKVGNKGVDFKEKSKVDSKAKEEKKTYKTPKSPFINQEKVVKRPLSKNVYRKEVKVPKEEPKGPVTIIEKPEKDAKVGLIVAIILTIILGAAAGTIAFLLIPK